MDKYEINIKTEQVKKLIRKRDFKDAARIADTIDFSKVKNTALLITVADVYETIGEYDKARDILVMAYERNQLGRQIAFRLTRVSVKRKDLEDAMDYYADFVDAAPRDASRYILQYDISKLQNDPVEKQIAILEKYIDDDMDDRWAYELATLYEKAGDKKKCVEMCDTIILWFSEGKYVDKAMELKMNYEPLTKSQQEKYDQRWPEREGINVEDIKVKEVSGDNKYDTYNIQAEIARSMVELLSEGKDKSDRIADEVEDNNTLVENDSYDDEEPEKTKEVVISGKADGNVEEEILEEEISQEEISEEETSEAETAEKTDDQIEGQVTLEELLNGMYKEPEEKSDFETFADIIAESMTAKEVISEEDEVEELIDIEEGEVAVSGDFREESIDDFLLERSENERLESEENMVTEEELNDLDKTVDLAIASSIAAILEQELKNAKDDIAAAAFSSDSADDKQEDDDNDADESIEDDVNSSTEEPEEDTASATEEESSEESSEEEKETDNNTADDVNEEEEHKETKQITAEESKKLLREFLDHYSGVEGLDKQVIKVFQNMLKNNNETNDFLYIMGDVKSGKTTLAMDIIKLVSTIRSRNNYKVAKVNGVSLNGKNIRGFLQKLDTCDVIIEKAASIEAGLFVEIMEMFDKSETKRIVVFEDERSLSDKFFEKNTEILEKFDNMIKLKHNKVKDWAKVAVEYAESQGYTIDEMGLLALHAKIDQLYTITLVIHKNHVEQIIDIAIENAESKSLGKMFKSLFKKKDKEMNVLTEDDFMS